MFAASLARLLGGDCCGTLPPWRDEIGLGRDGGLSRQDAAQRARCESGPPILSLHGVVFAILYLGSLRAEATDGLGLTGKADVGAHRGLIPASARTVDAVVGPPAAIRRTGLHRSAGFPGRAAWRDREFGRSRSVASGNDDRQCEREAGNEIVIWPHAVDLKAMDAGPVPARRALRRRAEPVQSTETRPW